MKKGQAAIEFLVTYGWAFIVVLVMVGALAYFGVFNPSTMQSQKCVSPLGFDCTNYVVNTDGQVFKFKNNLGYTISISGGVLKVADQLSPCSGPKNMVSAEQYFEIVCSKAELKDSELLKAQLSFSYYKSESGPSFTKTATSEVVVMSQGQPGQMLTKNKEGWIELEYVDFAGNHKIYVKNVGLKPWGVQEFSECLSPYCEHNQYLRILTKNNSISFQTYPAREECKNIGGYLAHANQISAIKNLKEFEIANAYFWTAAQDTLGMVGVYNAVAASFENVGSNSLQLKTYFPSAYMHYTTICVKDS